MRKLRTDDLVAALIFQHESADRDQVLAAKLSRMAEGDFVI